MKKTRTDRSDRPGDCDGDEQCTNRYHHAYARLMDALEEARVAAEAVLAMPAPRGEPGPKPSWYFSERESHRVVTEDAAGLLWVVRSAVASIEPILYPCSHATARREKMKRRLQRIAAEPTLTMDELFADEGRLSFPSYPEGVEGEADGAEEGDGDRVRHRNRPGGNISPGRAAF